MWPKCFVPDSLMPRLSPKGSVLSAMCPSHLMLLTAWLLTTLKIIMGRSAPYATNSFLEVMTSGSSKSMLRATFRILWMPRTEQLMANSAHWDKCWRLTLCVCVCYLCWLGITRDWCVLCLILLAWSAECCVVLSPSFTLYYELRFLWIGHSLI